MTDKQTDNPFSEVIYSYTRAQAIEDGVLVDVSEVAREAGIKWPVALTREAWEKCVAWDDKLAKLTGMPQDEAGRLWDVLWMLRVAIRSPFATGPQVDYQLQVVQREFCRGDNIESPKWTVKLKAVCGPGDDREPVITVMLPHED
jgi:hypothetical protein